MTDQELVNEVREMIAEIGELDNAEEISTEAHLIEDLGLDSMLLLEVLSSLEQNYGISIPESEFPNMNTINECVGVVKKYQSGEAAA